MRMGAKKRPFYRVVVADSRSPRDGRIIENIGRYHPLQDPSLIEIDEERALHWLGTGAQPSEPVRNLLRKVGIWEKFSTASEEKPKAGARTAAKRASAAKAAAAKEAPVPAPAAPTAPAAEAPAVEEPSPSEAGPEEPPEAAAEEPADPTPEAEAGTGEEETVEEPAESASAEESGEEESGG
jgi:small subunit ribosomal protein S16